MLSWKNTPSLQKCLFYVPRNSLLLLWKEKLLKKKKKRQLLSHCLHQRSLCHHSQITKRHRHCEAPAIPLAEQQPKPYWDSRGRGRLTAVEKGCELCSPSLSHCCPVTAEGAWHSLPPTSAAAHIHTQLLLWEETEELRRFLTHLLGSGDHLTQAKCWHGEEEKARVGHPGRIDGAWVSRCDGMGLSSHLHIWLGWSLAPSWQSWLWEVNHAAAPFLNRVLQKEISLVATWCVLYQHTWAVPTCQAHIQLRPGLGLPKLAFLSKCAFKEIQVALDLQTTLQTPDTLPHTYSCSGHGSCLWFILICWTGNYCGWHADQSWQPWDSNSQRGRVGSQ